MKKIIIVLAIALFTINTNAQDKAKCCAHKETMSTEEVAKCKAEGKKCTAKATTAEGKKCCAKKA